MMNKILIIIVFLYNILGTVTICSIMGSDRFYGDWTIWCTLLTFPIIFFSFIYRYTQAEPLYPVFIIQFIILLINLLIVYRVIKSKDKKAKRIKSNSDND